MLLVLTTRDDATTDFLFTYLEERNLPRFRLNFEDLKDTHLSFSAGRNGLHQLICTPQHEVALDDVEAIWLRRLAAPEVPASIDERFRGFVADEIRHTLEGMLAGCEAMWVNPLWTIHIAERKLHQLRVAQKHGLTVPATLVSNEGEELIRFAEGAASGVICKPLSRSLLVSDEEELAVYTHRVEADELREWQAELSQCPTLLQAFVEGTDVRVTVIGEDIYTVAVETEDEAHLDWRHRENVVSYSVRELPEAMESKIRGMMEILDILYGAFDFILTDDGEWYFLEVNPAGQWAWLEIELDLPMRESFAKLFYGDS